MKIILADIYPSLKIRQITVLPSTWILIRYSPPSKRITLMVRFQYLNSFNSRSIKTSVTKFACDRKSDSAKMAFISYPSRKLYRYSSEILPDQWNILNADCVRVHCSGIVGHQVAPNATSRLFTDSECNQLTPNVTYLLFIASIYKIRSRKSDFLSSALLPDSQVSLLYPPALHAYNFLPYVHRLHQNWALAIPLPTPKSYIASQKAFIKCYTISNEWYPSIPAKCSLKQTLNREFPHHCCSNPIK